MYEKLFDSDTILIEEGDETDTILITFKDTPLSITLNKDLYYDLREALESIEFFADE